MAARYGIADAIRDILARGSDAVQAVGQGEMRRGDLLNAAAQASTTNLNTDGGRYTDHDPACPPGVSIDANMAEAAKHWGDPLWFTGKVIEGGPWDYKRQGGQYEDCGNFNYGAAGTALGFAPETLLRAAGLVQSLTSAAAPVKRAVKGQAPSPGWDPSLGVFFGPKPYGDDPVDQRVIVNGINRGRRWQGG